MSRRVVMPVASRPSLSPRRGKAAWAALAAIGVSGVAAALLIGPTAPPPPPIREVASSRQVAPDAAAPRVASVSLRVDPRLLDPRPLLAGEARMMWPSAPPPGFFFGSLTAAALVLPEPARLAAAVPQAPPSEANGPLRAAPIPPPRPAELGPAGTERIGSRPDRRSRLARATAAAQPEDNRSFFERLFGAEPDAAPKLRYAALDSGPLKTTPAPQPSPSPAPSVGAGTAIYDIGARTVTLPNGERLEAHSGLGDKMDDPRQVHLRMRGATPPGTYDLTEREAPFHGVRAIRLNPVGGSAAVHGRAGLLAHTYLLGPSGQSNGCMSVREYDRFLNAYLRGDIHRLVVVAGARQDGLPGLFNRQFGLRDRTGDRSG